MYAFNLAGGEDSREPASLYQRILGGTIAVSTPSHSELVLPQGQTIVFSKPSFECPVMPGTVTLQPRAETKSLDWENLGFKLETSLQNYSSYLDPWQNRVWVYPQKSNF